MTKRNQYMYIYIYITIKTPSVMCTQPFVDISMNIAFQLGEKIAVCNPDSTLIRAPRNSRVHF